MAELITSEQLATLAVAVDNAAEARGWNEGHILVKVEAAPPPDDIELGMKDIDGHPLDTLLGFTAPPEWQAIGVCCEGWMAPMASGKRPSESKGRMRMRTTALVSRASGEVVSGVRKAGEDFELMPGEAPIGMVPDALRRALGLPTPAPEVPIAHWVAVMLFGLIVGDGGPHRRVGWSQLRHHLDTYEVLGRDGTWALLRKLAGKRSDLNLDLAPDVAAWMDDGMFARWVLGGLPSYDAMLNKARTACTPEAFRQVRRILREWGLPVRLRRAA
jgi:hypothetical protein